MLSRFLVAVAAMVATIAASNVLVQFPVELTLGGVLGIPVALYGWLAETGGNRPVWMLAGAALCAVFAGLCWKGYRPKEG